MPEVTYKGKYTTVQRLKKSKATLRGNFSNPGRVDRGTDQDSYCRNERLQSERCHGTMEEWKKNKLMINTIHITS